MKNIIIKCFIMVIILVGIGSYSNLNDLSPIQLAEDPDTGGMG